MSPDNFFNIHDKQLYIQINPHYSNAMTKELK